MMFKTETVVRKTIANFEVEEKSSPEDPVPFPSTFEFPIVSLPTESGVKHHDVHMNTIHVAQRLINLSTDIAAIKFPRLTHYVFLKADRFGGFVFLSTSPMILVILLCCNLILRLDWKIGTRSRCSYNFA